MVQLTWVPTSRMMRKLRPFRNWLRWRRASAVNPALILHHREICSNSSAKDLSPWTTDRLTATWIQMALNHQITKHSNSSYSRSAVNFLTRASCCSSSLRCMASDCPTRVSAVRPRLHRRQTKLICWLIRSLKATSSASKTHRPCRLLQSKSSLLRHKWTCLISWTTCLRV